MKEETQGFGVGKMKTGCLIFAYNLHVHSYCQCYGFMMKGQSHKNK